MVIWYHVSASVVKQSMEEQKHEKKEADQWMADEK